MHSEWGWARGCISAVAFHSSAVRASSPIHKPRTLPPRPVRWRGGGDRRRLLRSFIAPGRARGRPVVRHPRERASRSADRLDFFLRCTCKNFTLTHYLLNYYCIYLVRVAEWRMRTLRHPRHADSPSPHLGLGMYLPWIYSKLLLEFGTDNIAVYDVRLKEVKELDEGDCLRQTNLRTASSLMMPISDNIGGYEM